MKVTEAPLSWPAINAMIAAAVTAISWGAIAWGLQYPGVLTATGSTPGGIAIGLALAPAIIAPMMLLLYLKGVRMVRAARRGEGVLARWTVTADELAEFRTNDAARNKLGPEYRNGWKPPRPSNLGGPEVIFMADAVVVGRALYPLVNTGILRFAGVQVLPERPLSIEFGTVATTIMAQPFGVFRSKAALRFPVARNAHDDLQVVLRHFQQVDAREIVVNPGFYPRRIRFGLVAAPICFAAAAGAFLITPRSAGADEATLQLVGLTVIVTGIICGIGALVMAAAAWSLRQGQISRR